ncbi:hypothetical protein AYO20_11009 [Fonsecaea nubica]|uniref:Uncharacterized protein n=1 Tax=Fonsecaea nubica TaxID=856822 RepID=A0A178C0R6_9EURO|nr:hypothetical protein AYO20_11009 [Fonsecaea nubica]OAL23197.1 hypothetical protein AYO20_11009 [Fonsecaea nubica]
MDDHASPAMQPSPEETVEISLHLLRWLLHELDECATSLYAEMVRPSTSTSTTTSDSPGPSAAHLHGHDTTRLPSTDFQPYSKMPSPGLAVPDDFRVSLDGAEVERLATCALTATRALLVRYHQLQDRWRAVNLQSRQAQEAGMDLVTGLWNELHRVQNGSWDDAGALKRSIQGAIDRLVDRYLKAVKAAEGG